MTHGVCVVMPALDEADALPAALAGRPRDVRVVVVDNGSTDGTAEVAARLGAEVVTEPRRGFGAACARGVAAAAGAEVIVFMDADGTLDWDDLPAVVGPLHAGSADLVLGRRVAHRREPGAMPRHVAVANAVLGVLCGLFAGRRVHDVSPYRAVRRRSLERLALRDRSYGWPLEMVLRAGRSGLRIAEVPVGYRVRAGRSKVTGRPWPTVKAAARMAAVLLRLGRPRWVTVDRVAVTAVAGGALLAGLPVVLGGVVLGMDAATQFLPWYTWQGEQLRAGVLPGWNPHVLSGTPFAASPLSGWGNISATLLFTALRPAAALPLFLLGQLVLTATGTYALARSLRLSIAGAVVAASAYTLSGWVYLSNLCCFAFAGVAAWLPWLLLALTVAPRRLGRDRWRWWALGAVAAVQVLVAWPGQGTLYAFTLAGAWLAWRTLVARAAGPDRPPRWAQRLGALALHGVAVFGLAVALGAAVIVPGLETNAVSNLAGGYPGPGGAVRTGGWTPAEWPRLVLPGTRYTGVVVLALAAAAPLLARRRWSTPFLAIVPVVALVLALPLVTPLHLALEALPLAGRLHPNASERVMLVWFPAVALLAGASVTALTPLLRRRRWLGAALGVLLLVDLGAGTAAGIVHQEEHRLRSQRLARVDVAALLEPGPVGRFLADAGSGTGAGRVLVYAPELAGGTPTTTAYSIRWGDPLIGGLPVNNAAMTSGVRTVQGYDAVHLAAYDDLVHTLNGGRVRQDYHFADVRETGLGSPLLDLLSTRWIVVPATTTAADPTGAGALGERLPTVFDDGAVRVLRNRDALPAAWLVHEARRVAPGEAVPLLASGAVDPRRTALLTDAEPPPLGAPTDPAADAAEVVAYGSQAITVRTASDADALLVLSETAHPGWRATVDGNAAPVLTVDHALRGVAVPAGSHTVELRFAPASLRVGLAVSAATALLLVVGCLWWPSPDRKHARGRRRLRLPQWQTRRRLASSSWRTTRPSPRS